MTETITTPDTTGTTNATGTPPQTPKNEESIPKSRFDEVNSRMKSAEERAEMWKQRAEEFSKENEDAKGKFESLAQELKDKDRQVWKSNALAKIKPQVAKIANEMGVSFQGETQEEYDVWASGLEQKLAPYLKESATGVDGNRAGDFSTTITADELAKMTPEKRLEYGRKTLPRKVE